MKTVDQVLKYGVGAACLYEAFAIATNLSPTISHEVGVNWWLGPILLGALGAHFYWPHITKLLRKGKP